MPIGVSYQPKGAGAAVAAAAKKEEEEARKTQAMAFMLQKMGLDNQKKAAADQIALGYAGLPGYGNRTGPIGGTLSQYYAGMGGGPGYGASLGRPG